MLKYFMFISLAISLLLNLLYRISKKKRKSSFYSTLIELNLIGIVLEISLLYFGGSFKENILLVSLLERFYQLYLMLSMLILTLNLYSICYRNEEKKSKYYHRIRNFTYYFFYIVAVIMLFLPINFYEVSAPDGTAIDMVFAYSILAMASWLLSNIKNIKTLKLRNFIPYWLYILVFILFVILGNNIHAAHMVASVQLYILLIFPFTTRLNVEEVNSIEKNKEPIKEHISFLSMIEYNPVEIIEELIENTNKNLDKNAVTLEFTKDDEVPKSLEGDLLVIRSVVADLISESVENMPIGKLKINLDAVVKEEYCKLIVVIENNGGGYKDEEFSHLFDSSYPTKLSKTKDLVDKIGGKLVSINESGIGTKFIFAIEQNIKL